LPFKEIRISIDASTDLTRGSVKMRLQMSSVTLSYLIHATEDEDRLNQTILASIGLDSSELYLNTMEGHHGNRVILAKAHLIGKRATEATVRLARNLTPSSKTKLLSELDRSLDEHDALYLRFNRQNLSSGFSLSDDEPIRVKLKPRFRIGGREAMKQVYVEELGLA
jgi:RNA binding exosome subunit